MAFYGQWTPPVDQVLYENYFKDKKNGFFVESGGYDGITFSCCKFFEDNGWSGVNVEPARNHYADCVKNRPKALNLNVGLGDKAGELMFRNTSSPTGAGAGNGSFYHDEKHLEELKNYNASFDEYKVKVITFKDMIEDHDIKSVDLMCLDVEGFEFNVLDGMKGSDVLPNVMCIEYSYLGLENLVRYIKDLGYVFDFISHNNAYFHHKSFPVNKKGWFGQTNQECYINRGNIAWKNVNINNIIKITQ